MFATKAARNILIGGIAAGTIGVFVATGIGVAQDDGSLHEHVWRDRDPVPAFDLYEHPDVYWVFQHRETLCTDAQASRDSGLSLAEAIDETVAALPFEAATINASLYLRGVLAGCVTT